jgi:citrate synthase
MTDTTTGSTALRAIDGNASQLPIGDGTRREPVLDSSAFLASTGPGTLGDGRDHTGSGPSAVTFIDGDQGILRYRGIMRRVG